MPYCPKASNDRCSSSLSDCFLDPKVGQLASQIFPMRLKRQSLTERAIPLPPQTIGWLARILSFFLILSERRDSHLIDLQGCGWVSGANFPIHRARTMSKGQSKGDAIQTKLEYERIQPRVGTFSFFILFPLLQQPVFPQQHRAVSVSRIPTPTHINNVSGVHCISEKLWQTFFLMQILPCLIIKLN